ncbi:sialin-like [Diadema antillarum]|uniref:sialin-like n=1 Tax=Diadema antillarum TaxID=105358 RepID=UPI003A88FD31
MTAVCAMRQNVSVAMVAMVNDTYVTQQVSRNGSVETFQTCQQNADTNNTSTTEGDGEFLWDAHTQELLFAAFFYGYILTQIPGGWLADKYGMKWVLGFGFLLSSVCTLVGPVAAMTDFRWYFVTRFFSGFGEGVSFPSMLAMWSKWAHPSERSSLSVIGFAGFNFGNIVGNALSGFLINLNIAGGWPFTFYIYGSCGVVWVIAWCFLGYSSPAEHPWISVEEKKYLEEGLRLSGSKGKVSVPWAKMLTSPTMWVLVFTHFSHTCGIFTLLVNLPLYFSDGIRVPIEQAGVYSALPFILQFVVMIAASYLTDRLLAREVIGKTAIRKLMSGIGFFSGSFFLILTGFASCNIGMSVAFVTLAMGGIGFSFAGHFVSLLDVAGVYAGSAMGMMNTAGTLGGIVGPYIVGVFTEVQSDISGWQKVMWFLAGVYAFGGLTFVLFGTTRLQNWARLDEGSKQKYDVPDESKADSAVTMVTSET